MSLRGAWTPCIFFIAHSNHASKTVENLAPSGGDDDDEVYEDDAGDLSDDSLENPAAAAAEKGEKRLSPEKEIALQTLDDVLNEAEKSMGGE